MDMSLKMIQIYFILTRFHGRRIVQEKLKLRRQTMIDVSQFQLGFPACSHWLNFLPQIIYIHTSSSYDFYVRWIHRNKDCKIKTAAKISEVDLVI